MDDEKKEVKVGTVGQRMYNPIQETLKSAGIVMPDMVATGDLTVEPKEDKSIEKFNKKKIPLPEIGDKFMLNGYEYVVNYINPGNHRFTCEPCKGIY